MPYTWASAPLSDDSLSRNVQSSLVHTELKAAGKKASTTARPRSALSVTGSRSWFGNVKSGAGEPTSIDMNVLQAVRAGPLTRCCRRSFSVAARTSNDAETGLHIFSRFG